MENVWKVNARKGLNILHKIQIAFFGVFILFKLVVRPDTQTAVNTARAEKLSEKKKTQKEPSKVKTIKDSTIISSYAKWANAAMEDGCRSTLPARPAVRRVGCKSRAGCGSSLSKIVKTRAIFMLFGMMGLTFLAEGQTGIQGIMSDPRDYTDPIYTGPGSEMANRPLGRPSYRARGVYPKFHTPSYIAPNSTPQMQSGRTLQWKTGAGQQFRLDRLYVGQDANLVLQALGRPDKVSWQYDTWTYQNLNIQNPSTRRQYHNVTFVVKNRKIKVASVH